MKRMFSLLGAAVLLFALSSCGSAVPASSATALPESVPASAAAVSVQSEQLEAVLTRLFDCATLPEGAELTPEWLIETFPECTESACRKSLYDKGVAGMALFPNAIPGTACRYAPAQITTEERSAGNYSYQAVLDVTDGAYPSVTLSGQLQTDEAGQISYISFDEVAADGKLLPGGLVEVYRSTQ